MSVINVTEKILFTDVNKQPTFKCPYCKEVTSHYWYFRDGPFGDTPRIANKNTDNETLKIKKNILGLIITNCNSCGEKSYWLKYMKGTEELIFPHQYDYPEPHMDLPETIVPIYNQAGQNLSISIGAATALSRVCLEKLLIHLGYKNGSLNDKIAAVIAEHKVSSQTADILDTIRFFGNTGAHAGTIDLDESQGVAQYILTSINDVVDELITKPKKVKKYYDLLPEGVKGAIQKRDTPSD